VLRSDLPPGNGLDGHSLQRGYDRSGWKPASPLSDAPSWIPDIRLTTEVGRNRNGSFRARSTKKVTLRPPLGASAATDPSTNPLRGIGAVVEL
jgi:hypothetical protein